MNLGTERRTENENLTVETARDSPTNFPVLKQLGMNDACLQRESGSLLQELANANPNTCLSPMRTLQCFPH